MIRQKKKEEKLALSKHHAEEKVLRTGAYHNCSLHSHNYTWVWVGLGLGLNLVWGLAYDLGQMSPIFERVIATVAKSRLQLELSITVEKGREMYNHAQEVI